jgi:anaphase-promoting complex subunit 3
VDDLLVLFLLYYEGKKLPESRYLFAMSCFRMNLLREAEDTLCPVNETNETNIEVCSMFVK